MLCHISKYYNKHYQYYDKHLLRKDDFIHINLDTYKDLYLNIILIYHIFLDHYKCYQDYYK